MNLSYEKSNDKSLLPLLDLCLDVEADGTNPLTHSMLSFGVVAVDPWEQVVDQFYIKLKPRFGLEPDPKTMKNFWNLYPIQYQETQTDALDHELGMQMFGHWIFNLSHTYRMQWWGAPSSTDWMFLKCYYDAYVPQDYPNRVDIGFRCDDLSSMLTCYMNMMRVGDRKEFIKRLCTPQIPETRHHALFDAGHTARQLIALKRLMRSAHISSSSGSSSSNSKKHYISHHHSSLN